MEKVSINKTMHLSEHLASPSEAALSHSSELNGLRLTPHASLLARGGYQEQAY